ncbi:hypothetical protein D9M68_17940 [compost metagenome]
MMQITDVIKVMGNAPLGKFPWGCTVRDTVNLFLDPKIIQLTDASTGVDIQTAIDSLPDDVRQLILVANLDPSRHCIATPVGGGMVVEHVESSTDQSENPVEGLTNALTRPLSLATAMVVIMVVLVAVFLASGLSANKDFDWKGLFRAAFEMLGLTSG